MLCDLDEDGNDHPQDSPQHFHQQETSPVTLQERQKPSQERQTGSQQLGSISGENIGVVAKLTSHQMAFAPHPLINWPPLPPPPRQTLPLKKHSGDLKNGPFASSNQVKIFPEDRNSICESKLEFSGNQVVCGVSNPTTYSSPSCSNPLIQNTMNTKELSTLTNSTNEGIQEAASCSAKSSTRSSECPCLRSTITPSNSSHGIVSSNHLTTSASPFTKKINDASNFAPSDVKSATSAPKCDQSQKPGIKAKPQLSQIDRQPKENIDKIRSFENEAIQHSTENDHVTDCCEREAKFSDADQIDPRSSVSTSPKEDEDTTDGAEWSEVRRFNTSDISGSECGGDDDDDACDIDDDDDDDDSSDSSSIRTVTSQDSLVSKSTVVRR